jgi:hypothetical protein
MRSAFPLPLLVALLATTACSSQESGGSYGSANESSFEAADEASMAPSSSRSRSPTNAATGPNVSPTAAPGVAFNYRYAFRLPAERIAQVQEKHAQTCESLGAARCRITGMHYRVVNANDIEAMLEFRLDPAIARRFGQQGVQEVASAEGMLTESEIRGTEVASAIRRAGRSISEMTERLRQLDQRLARRDLSTEERDRLDYEAQQLRQQIAAAQANREEQQDVLANTPMVFHYGSGDLVPGFNEPPSIRRELNRAAENFLYGLTLIFVLIITLLPWVLLGLFGWWVVQLIRRRFRPAAPVGESSPPIEEPQVS